MPGRQGDCAEADHVTGAPKSCLCAQAWRYDVAPRHGLPQLLLAFAAQPDLIWHSPSTRGLHSLSSSANCLQVQACSGSFRAEIPGILCF